MRGGISCEQVKHHHFHSRVLLNGSSATTIALVVKLIPDQSLGGMAKSKHLDLSLQEAIHSTLADGIIGETCMTPVLGFAKGHALNRNTPCQMNGLLAPTRSFKHVTTNSVHDQWTFTPHAKTDRSPNGPRYPSGEPHCVAARAVTHVTSAWLFARHHDIPRPQPKRGGRQGSGVHVESCDRRLDFNAPWWR